MCTDDPIFERFIEGDCEAMSQLVEMFQHDLYNLCFRLTFNRHDADDLFQETWLKAIRNAGNYEHQAFKAWLFRICLNQYRDQYRHNSRRRRIIKDDFESTSAKDYILTSVDDPDQIEEQYEKKYVQALLVTNINRLPERHKLPIVLFYYQQMNYADIAATLQIPEGTVKSRINTAKKKLRSVLEREWNV